MRRPFGRTQVGKGFRSIRRLDGKPNGGAGVEGKVADAGDVDAMDTRSISGWGLGETSEQKRKN